MLTYSDSPTIRHAILKRLDKERGVKVCDLPIHRHADCIRVGIIATLDGPDGLVVRSRFDLPLEFELTHLHNEIDEIAEQYKMARADFWLNGRTLRDPEKELSGSGMRGRWTQ